MLWVPPTAPESAIKRTRSGAEQRARTTAATTIAAAQNGTYACARVLQACSALGGLGHASNRRLGHGGLSSTGGLAHAIQGSQRRLKVDAPREEMECQGW